MLEFGFTEEQEMFRQETRRFARRELAPLARDGKAAEEYKKAIEGLKLNSLNFPEKYGGWQLDYVSTLTLAEELYMAGSMLGGMPFETTFNGIDVRWMLPETADEIAPGLVNRTATNRHGYTEGNSGNEQAAIQTKAVRKGDDYIINGSKTPASGAASSTYCIVTAVTDPAAAHNGISMFLVPRSLPGVSWSLVPFASEAVANLGRRGAPASTAAGGACVMSFDDVKIPARYLVGELGKGLVQLEWVHNLASNMALTLTPLCEAQLSLNEMIEFTKKRVHFGQPLIRNQGISFQFAEHHTLLTAARMLMYNAMWLRDQGRPHSAAVSMAKWWGIEMAEKVMIECLHIGGLGHWSTESPVAARAMRNVGQQIVEGGTQIHKLKILREIAPEALPPGMAERLTN